MIAAAIDIGTNTVLLLVARIDDAGGITPLIQEQRLPRLGAGVDAARRLAPDAMRRTVDVLRDYLTLLGSLKPDVIVACATSAVRDASNREEFLEAVRSETGIAIEVLSGEEEALWTYRGAISGLPRPAAATVVDVGGGSTEITVGDRHTVHRRCSLDIGSVRLTERWFRHDPPGPSEIEGAAGAVRAALDGAGVFHTGGTELVGVAGTATSLAHLNQGLKRFDIQAVINYSLSLDAIEALFVDLRSRTARRIRELSDVMEGRADVITAGTLILREVMIRHGFSALTVSERGVRYGLALRAWESSSRMRRSE